ncbi:MAG: hypothetical protein WBK91_03960 [Alphaproteobacteria bacterium]
MSATVTRIHTRHTPAPPSAASSLVNDNDIRAAAQEDDGTIELEAVLISITNIYLIIVLGLITCIAVLCFIIMSPLLALHYLLTRRDVREYLWFLIVIGGSIALLQFLEIATGHAS